MRDSISKTTSGQKNPTHQHEEAEIFLSDSSYPQGWLDSIGMDTQGGHHSGLPSDSNVKRRVSKKMNLDSSNGFLIPETDVDLSVVIPIKDEEENVELLYAELNEVLSKMPNTYEIICIDDGSRDSTYSKLTAIQKKDYHLSVIRFRRNFGQTAAISAGFDHAKGKVVMLMDGDLQNDPHDIPRLLAKIGEGYDVVSGWRKHRQDKMVSRRIPSMIANRVISYFTNVHLHDYGCTLKAYRSEVAKNVNLYGEMHRFIPALASWMGVNVTELEVNHRARRFGKSKYGISRTIRVILDLITIKFLLSYASKPMQAFGLLGILAMFLGLATGTWLTVDKLFLNNPLSDRPLLLLAILLVFTGLQFFTLGLLGEYLTRIYYEVQGKPRYAVKNFSSWSGTPAIHSSVDLPEIDEEEKVLARIEAKNDLVSSR